MIVVVLFTLLLLAGILAATVRLSLGSRQNTADQAATLRAQYTAESGLALARSRIRDIQKLLTTNNITLPAGTLASTIEADAEKFCGNAVWTSVTTAGVTTRTCTAQASAASDQFSVLNRALKSTAYAAVLPPEEARGAGTLEWWKSQIGQPVRLGSDSTEASYTIQPVKVEVVGTRYRFHLNLSQVTSRGESGAGTRLLTGQAAQGGGWWFDVSLPPFLDNVLFTNFHRTKGSSTPNIGFSNQVFDGPVHTNEKFVFYSDATASFRQKVTSAGCTNLATLPAGSATCTAQAGVYLGSNINNISLVTGTSAQVKSQIDSYTDVSWNSMEPGHPQFEAPYRPMPTTAETQKTAAQAGGLYLGPAGTSVRGIEFRAATDQSGTVPSTYDATTQSWTPAPTQQFITVTSNTGTKTVYRYASDRKLYKKNTRGGWDWVKDNFNGVVFADGRVGARSFTGSKSEGLTGPGRDGSGRPYPALAPFAQMTVAGSADMYISGDLSMSQTPLTCDDTDADCIARNKQRTNVLGLYTQSGDIVITESAPSNLNLHAMVMSASGEVTVDNYQSSTYRGTVQLIGGLVENYYGGFGDRLGTAYASGYGRDFRYDRRFQDIPGFGPPSYPVSPVWQAADAGSVGKRLDDFLWRQSRAGAP
ncbi:hypothetical protein [Deinococcus wulumuqiensis]|uniref:hypothetical protein n=1 Tax=Deinococcus wulumuqiensis TaxID=980427 RepID=UPI0024315A47|nr:hypothetical protein [Deinococcus wulumuqiensis]